jgi:hypothetical protein
MTDIEHLEPEYLSFMPALPTVPEPAPDVAAEYLGRADDRSD